MLDTVVISGEDVCCGMVFGTLVDVSMFSGVWSELLMTSAISCPLWSSVYECQRVECVFTSPVRSECDMFVRCCMQCCMSVSIRFSACMCCLKEVYKCNSDVFSVVNMYPDHLKFCVLMVEGMSVVVNVMLSLTSVMSPPLSCATYSCTRW